MTEKREPAVTRELLSSQKKPFKPPPSRPWTDQEAVADWFDGHDQLTSNVTYTAAPTQANVYMASALSSNT